jgi:hypothetical protein
MNMRVNILAIRQDTSTYGVARLGYNNWEAQNGWSDAE